jgi:hypothetical protein
MSIAKPAQAEQYTIIPRDFKRRLHALGYRGNDIVLLLEFYERWEAKRAALTRESKPMEAVRFSPKHARPLVSERTFRTFINNAEGRILLRHTSGDGRRMGSYFWNHDLFNSAKGLLDQGHSLEESKGNHVDIAGVQDLHSVSGKNCTQEVQQLLPPRSGNEEAYEEGNERPLHSPVSAQCMGANLRDPETEPPKTWNERLLARRSKGDAGASKVNPSQSIDDFLDGLKHAG